MHSVQTNGRWRALGSCGSGRSRLQRTDLGTPLHVAPTVSLLSFHTLLLPTILRTATSTLADLASALDLSIVAFFGQADRSLIERCRADEDSASLLDRMTRRGLLAKVRSDRGQGGPNVYRVTTKALRAAGFATVEAMRAAVSRQVDASAHPPGEYGVAAAGAAASHVGRVTTDIARSSYLHC